MFYRTILSFIYKKYYSNGFNVIINMKLLTFLLLYNLTKVCFILINIVTRTFIRKVFFNYFRIEHVMTTKILQELFFYPFIDFLMYSRLK